MGGGRPEPVFENQQGLITGTPTEVEEIYSWRVRTRFSVHQDPGKETVTWLRDWARLTLVLRSSNRGDGVVVAHCRGKHTGNVSSGEYSLARQPPGGAPRQAEATIYPL